MYNWGSRDEREILNSRLTEFKRDNKNQWDEHDLSQIKTLNRLFSISSFDLSENDLKVYIEEGISIFKDKITDIHYTKYEINDLLSNFTDSKNILFPSYVHGCVHSILEVMEDNELKERIMYPYIDNIREMCNKDINVMKIINDSFKHDKNFIRDYMRPVDALYSLDSAKEIIECLKNSEILNNNDRYCPFEFFEHFTEIIKHRQKDDQTLLELLNFVVDNRNNDDLFQYSGSVFYNVIQKLDDDPILHEINDKSVYEELFKINSNNVENLHFLLKNDLYSYNQLNIASNYDIGKLIEQYEIENLKPETIDKLFLSFKDGAERFMDVAAAEKISHILNIIEKEPSDYFDVSLFNREASEILVREFQRERTNNILKNF